MIVVTTVKNEKEQLPVIPYYELENELWVPTHMIYPEIGAENILVRRQETYLPLFTDDEIAAWRMYYLQYSDYSFFPRCEKPATK